jgi:hypothetical protein
MSAAQLRTNSPVNISRVLANAAVFDFRRHSTRESFMDASNISQEAEELFDLLEARGTPFLLVGGLAMLAHVRGRNTDDVDLIISVPDQKRLEPEVALVGRYKQLRVDYLDAGAPFFRLIAEQYGERRRFDFLRGGRELVCANPAGLMLLKMHALPHVTRAGDWERVNAYENDVLMLWLAHPEIHPAELLPVLAPFVDDAGRFSLQQEVLPDLVRRRARMHQSGA